VNTRKQKLERLRQTESMPADNAYKKLLTEQTGIDVWPNLSST